MKREICRKLSLLIVSLVFLGLTMPAQADEVKVYAFKAGLLKTETQYLLKDTRVGTPMDIPIPFFVIRHGKEWIAFDTGCNAEAAKDPVGYLGEGGAKAFSPVLRPDQEFQAGDQDSRTQTVRFQGRCGQPRPFRPCRCDGEFLGTIRAHLFPESRNGGDKKDRRVPKAARRIFRSILHIKELNIREIEGLFDIIW